MEEITMIGRRFGDEKSTLLDEFERLSFEAHASQLNKAMMGRSLSEPRLQRSHSRLITIAPIPLVTHVMQEPRLSHSCGRRFGSGFYMVLKKLINPIVGRKKVRGGRKHVSHSKDIMFCKTFSKSFRL